MRTTTASFTTTDLALAAFLITRGHALIRLDGLAGGRRVFSFASDARADAESFFRQAAVPAQAFANALRDLKTLIHQL